MGGFCLDNIQVEVDGEGQHRQESDGQTCCNYEATRRLALSLERYYS